MRYTFFLPRIAILFTSVICAQKTSSSSSSGTVFAPPLPTLVDPQILPRFEIDVVFPRNETYNASASEAFPIAFVVQNFTEIGILGNFTILWDIMPFSYGRVPGGIDYDAGTFTLPADPGEGPVVLVDSTNVTKWIRRKDRDERFMLWWHVHWNSLRNCSNYGPHTVFNGIMFDVETPDEAESRRFRNENATAIGKPADVAQARRQPLILHFGELG